MSWVLALSGFAALVVLHEAGHFLAAKAVGMRVEKFFLFFPPKVASIKRGETEYGIGAIPLGGYVRITGMNPEEEIPQEVAHRAYYRQPVWKRIVVIAAGPLVNIVLAFLIFFAIAVGFGFNKGLTNVVADVYDELPAAGQLVEGDVILAVDGKRVADLRNRRLHAAVANQLDKHRCAGKLTDGCEAKAPVEVTILRDGERQTVSITPVYVVPDAAERESGVEPAMKLGFAYEPAGRDRFSVVDGAQNAADRLWFVTSRTAEVFAGIFEAENREQITSVVGATEVTRQSFEFDLRQALGVLGVISLSLGLVNLLPFLPLDGGHIFWALVEKLRGRPVPLAVMERSGVVGFALVLILFFIGLQNDIGRLTGEGFDVR